MDTSVWILRTKTGLFALLAVGFCADGALATVKMPDLAALRQGEYRHAIAADSGGGLIAWSAWSQAHLALMGRESDRAVGRTGGGLDLDPAVLRLGSADVVMAATQTDLSDVNRVPSIRTTDSDELPGLRASAAWRGSSTLASIGYRR